MASWVQLRIAAFDRPAGTVLRVDQPGQVAQLVNSGIAVFASDPGGAPPALPADNPGGQFATDAEILDPSSALGAQLKAAFVAGEIAYAETATQPATTTADFQTAAVTIPGLSVTFTLDRTTRVEVALEPSSWRNTTAGFGVGLLIKDGGGAEQARAFAKSGTASMDFPIRCAFRKTLPAGTYSYVAYWGAYGGGTAQLNAGATFPIRLTVDEV